MNQRQKSTVKNLTLVFVVTIAFVLVMVNVKDAINKSEAMRAMALLAEEVQKYRKMYRSTPPESHILQYKEKITAARLGELHYRAQWIAFDDEPNTVLAYSFKDYQFLVRKGYVVMRLDGCVEWMSKSEFEDLLSKQQKHAEIELLHKSGGLR